MATDKKITPKGKAPAGAKKAPAVVLPVIPMATVPSPAVNMPVDIQQPAARPAALDIPPKAVDNLPDAPVVANTTAPVASPVTDESTIDTGVAFVSKSYTNTRIGKFVVSDEVWLPGESKTVSEETFLDKRFQHALILKVLVED